MRSALSSLQQIVGLKQQKKRSGKLGLRKDVRFSNQKPIPPGGLKELEMPPVQIVIDLLRDIKGTFVPRFSYQASHMVRCLCRRQC